MFLDHFIKAFWATVIILVVVMCVTDYFKESVPVHTDVVEIEAQWERE